MRLPTIHGLIRRRLLINFRVDAAVAARLLPPPFRLKLHDGFGIASICLIRLEHVRRDGFRNFAASPVKTSPIVLLFFGTMPLVKRATAYLYRDATPIPC